MSNSLQIPKQLIKFNYDAIGKHTKKNSSLVLLFIRFLILKIYFLAILFGERRLPPG